MQCQKRRVYGLCRLSVSVSAGEGDTLTKYDNITHISTTFATNRRNSKRINGLWYYWVYAWLARFFLANAATSFLSLSFNWKIKWYTFILLPVSGTICSLTIINVSLSPILLIFIGAKSPSIVFIHFLFHQILVSETSFYLKKG